MKNYKITVYLNRITIPWQEDFQKAKEYHFKHGVNIEFTFQQIDVHGYQSHYNEEKNRWLIQGAENLITLDVKSDANIFVFDMGEWSSQAESEYPLKPETPNGSCALLNGKPFICIGTYIIDHDNGQTWIQIAHEIMHSLVQNAYIKGINVVDVMDTYRENSNPDSPTGNFAEQWKLIEPFILKK